jgi:hypothetical protein
MYYKIENKECEVYQKLHEMRAYELKISEENKQAIKDKSGLDFESFYGHSGQQNFRRVTGYTGFKFTEPEKVDSKVWQRHKEHNDIFIPNKKTKLGREMDEFISNGLKGSNFNTPLKILGLEHPRRFSFPFVDIAGEIIVLFLDDQFEPKDENVIEITKREFDALRS